MYSYRREKGKEKPPVQSNPTFILLTFLLTPCLVVILFSFSLSSPKILTLFFTTLFSQIFPSLPLFFLSSFSISLYPALKFLTNLLSVKCPPQLHPLFPALSCLFCFTHFPFTVPYFFLSPLHLPCGGLTAHLFFAISHYLQSCLLSQTTCSALEGFGLPSSSFPLG